MSPALTASRLLEEGSAVFANSGYALFNIEAHLVCIIVLVILFFKQQNSSDQTEAQLVWSRLLFAQILYCLTGIFRVLVDVNVIPKSPMSQYVITALNIGIFGWLCLLTFAYIELYHKSDLINTMHKRIISSLPFIFITINLILSPWTGLFFEVSDSSMRNGILFPLVVAINLAYPTAAVALALVRRNKMGRYERDSASIMAIYPAFFMICGPLQAFNWRIPFLCYAIMISDIFVYINYADSLVSIDPLTKIPNRNGLIQDLSAKLSGMAGSETEGLYLFVVDIDDLRNINSSYGRQEGDRALVLVAEALKKFQSEEHECYISRYYSDEFIITSKIGNDEELDLFVEHIRNYISNAVMSLGVPYVLRVSVGYSKYEQYSRTETIAGLIEEADRVMEENKEQKKFQALWRGGKSSE